MNCPICARDMDTSVYRADGGARWQLYVCDVCELEVALTEHCPACDHELEEHTVNEDGRLFQLFWCDSCEADYMPVGFSEWLMRHER